MIKDTLKRFATAWREGNIEELLEFFTEDAIYSPSINNELGKSYKGKNEIKDGILRMMENNSGSVSTIQNIQIHGDFGFWEWTYHFPDGSEDKGCDTFQFEGNKIKLKNAFRKIQF